MDDPLDQSLETHQFDMAYVRALQNLVDSEALTPSIEYASKCYVLNTGVDKRRRRHLQKEGIKAISVIESGYKTLNEYFVGHIKKCRT